MSESEQPRILVDSDWKSEAQKERERLAAQARERKATGPGGAPGEAPPEGPIDFPDLIRLLATQALMYLGAFPDPQSGRGIVAMDVAKAHIDMLGVLEEKTRGNLTDDEQKMLSGTLSELRMQYVEIAKAVAKAVEEGRISPADVGASAGSTPPPPPPPPSGGGT